MALVAALSECLSSADARFQTLVAPDSHVVPLIDAFFSKATTLQLHRDQLKALPKEAQTALNEETRLVFLLYMRIFALLKKQPQRSDDEEQRLLLDSVLHMTRIVPFCQLYARNNEAIVQAFVDELVEHVDGFEARVGTLHDIYLNVCSSVGKSGVCIAFLTIVSFVDVQHLQKLHAAAQQDKRNQVLELIHSVYEISLSLRGLFASETLTKRLLLNNGKDPERMLQSESLLRALVVSYESDLPILQRHLVKLDEKAQGKSLIIAETRRLLLQDKISAFLESGEMESDHLSYLEMIVDGLPRRRIIRADMIDSDKKSTNAQGKHGPGSRINEREEAKGEAFPPVDDEDEQKEDYGGGGGDDGATMLVSMVHQVKDFFPDLGDGYVELCLLSSQKQLETVINFLLESNPPPALLDVPRDLKRSDPQFAAIEAKLTGKAPPLSAKAATEQKLDPTRVWVGKKPQEKHYDPQIAKKDAVLVEKTKEIAEIIVEEEEIMAGMVPFLKLDEYDDDYNDEFEDYEPFSVHDGGLGDDQDSIRKHNRLLLAREAEDAFWESMKNPNHQYPAGNDDEDEVDDGEEEEKVSASNTTKPAFRSPTSQQRQTQPNRNTQAKQNPQSKKNASAPPKKNGPAAADGAVPPTMTKEQELRARARNAKNKAKVGNHHRKDRALKKQG